MDVNRALTDSTPRTRSFEYTELERPESQIRLLELLPSNWQSGTGVREPFVSNDLSRSIHCRLRHVYIDNPPQYKALSYCWGENVFSHKVTIESQEQATTSSLGELAITASLDSAIRHLRHSTESVILWIDQICINQKDDNDEKTHQVKIMARIYTQAQQVLVWLGPADHDSDDAMGLYREVGDAIWERGLQDYCNKDMLPFLDVATQNRDPNDQLWQNVNAVQCLARELLLPRLQAMVDWDRRQWFSRVWVIQEFCVCADTIFVCGHKRVPVDYVKTTRLFLGLRQTHGFIKAVRNIGVDQLRLLQSFNNEDPTPAFFSVRSWRQKFQRRESSGDTLLQLLCKTFVGREAHATLPIDRIASLLGLANDRDVLGIEVDYKRKAADILTECAKGTIERGNLTVLAYAQFPKDVPGLPSWVPDWHPNLSPSFYPYPPLIPEDEPFFSPLGNHAPAIIQGLDKTVIGLRGFTVDTVQDVGSIWTDDPSVTPSLQHQSLLSQIRYFCRMSVSKNQPIYTSIQRRAQAEWRIPIADIWEANEAGPGQRQRATPRAMMAYVGHCNTIAWFESGCLGANPVADDDKEPSFYRLSMSKMSGMRPFVTSLGYVGMGPPGMCSGDVVTIFFGARVCSVLRPKGMLTNMAKQYLYIGEAYCDGVMDGELVGHRWEEGFYLI